MSKVPRVSPTGNLISFVDKAVLDQQTADESISACSHLLVPGATQNSPILTKLSEAKEHADLALKAIKEAQALAHGG